MEPAQISVGIAILTTFGGIISGIAVGAWVVSAKNKDLKSHGDSIKEIKDRCEKQKNDILTELENRICAGIKSAIQGLELEYKTSLAAVQLNVAVLESKVSQSESDIITIFDRCDRRYHQQPVEIDRRSHGQH